MKETTALQTLISELEKIEHDTDEVNDNVATAYANGLRKAIDIAAKLLPKEREQIEIAFDAGADIYPKFDSASDYFNNKYQTK